MSFLDIICVANQKRGLPQNVGQTSLQEGGETWHRQSSSRPYPEKAYERTKVAAYCRVSSNSADQLNSYAAQIKAYTKLIKSNDSWELIDIFADEGLSGMKAENRVEFQRMIVMCEHKQIDLIITKSVSRFARNVKEALGICQKAQASRNRHPV